MTAHEEVRRGTNDEVKVMAAKTKADPAKEIGEMQELFTSLG